MRENAEESNSEYGHFTQCLSKTSLKFLIQIHDMVKIKMNPTYYFAPITTTFTFGLKMRKFIFLQGSLRNDHVSKFM